MEESLAAQPVVMGITATQAVIDGNKGFTHTA
jgi:hypothetical protein